MKIRTAIKILGSIHTRRPIRVRTWKRSVARYKKYRQDDGWIEQLFQRLFTACNHGPRSIRPLRNLRDEIAERASAATTEHTKEKISE